MHQVLKPTQAEATATKLAACRKPSHDDPAEFCAGWSAEKLGMVRNAARAGSNPENQPRPTMRRISARSPRSPISGRRRRRAPGRKPQSAPGLLSQLKSRSSQRTKRKRHYQIADDGAGPVARGLARNRSLQTLPAEVTQTGSARTVSACSGHAEGRSMTAKFCEFAREVLVVEPDNRYPGIGRTIVRAFIQAGWALLSIAICSGLRFTYWRRAAHACPLILAGVVTRNLRVDRPAAQRQYHRLPLLLGVGVAFKIYHGVAIGPDPAAAIGLTRAIIFSARRPRLRLEAWRRSEPSGHRACVNCWLLNSLLHPRRGGVSSALMGPPREDRAEQNK